jgi:uncharacterized protein
LRRAGKQPSLLVGPWTHISAGLNGMLIREALAWLEMQVKGKPGREHELPVHLFVMGEKTWRHFADWPPPARPERWYLHPGGQLLPSIPPNSEPDHYRYDPADPTPAVGGNSIGGSGSHENGRSFKVVTMEKKVQTSIMHERRF